MKSLDDLFRSGGQDLQLEIESLSVAKKSDSSISYGLNIRQSTVNSDGGVIEWPRSDPSISYGLRRLPEDRGLEEFNEMPVEGFGATFLGGYGWYEGRRIGKKAKGDVKVVQYEKSAAKEGLGFVSFMYANRDKKTDTTNLILATLTKFNNQ